MAVEAADIVRRLPVAVPPQVLLDGLLGGAMGLGGHDGLCTGQRKLGSRGQRGTLEQHND